MSFWHNLSVSSAWILRELGNARRGLLIQERNVAGQSRIGSVSLLSPNTGFAFDQAIPQATPGLPVQSMALLRQCSITIGLGNSPDRDGGLFAKLDMSPELFGEYIPARVFPDVIDPTYFTQCELSFGTLPDTVIGTRNMSIRQFSEFINFLELSFVQEVGSDSVTACVSDCRTRSGFAIPFDASVSFCAEGDNQPQAYAFVELSTDDFDVRDFMRQVGTLTSTTPLVGSESHARLASTDYDFRLGKFGDDVTYIGRKTATKRASGVLPSASGRFALGTKTYAAQREQFKKAWHGVHVEESAHWSALSPVVGKTLSVEYMAPVQKVLGNGAFTRTTGFLREIECVAEFSETDRNDVALVNNTGLYHSETENQPSDEKVSLEGINLSWSNHPALSGILTNPDKTIFALDQVAAADAYKAAWNNFYASDDSLAAASIGVEYGSGLHLKFYFSMRLIVDEIEVCASVSGGEPSINSIEDVLPTGEPDVSQVTSGGMDAWEQGDPYPVRFMKGTQNVTNFILALRATANMREFPVDMTVWYERLEELEEIPSGLGGGLKDMRHVSRWHSRQVAAGKVEAILLARALRQLRVETNLIDAGTVLITGNEFTQFVEAGSLEIGPAGAKFATLRLA